MDTAQKSAVNAGIGEVVRHLLLSTHQPRADLAALLGCHPKTLERRINGGYPWEAWEVGLMAAHFDVPVSLFYEGPGAFLAMAKNIAFVMADAIMAA